MAARVLLVLAGVAGFLEVVYLVISLLLVRSVDNGVSRHIVDGSGVLRGAGYLFVAVVLALLAWAVRPTH